MQLLKLKSNCFAFEVKNTSVIQCVQFIQIYTFFSYIEFSLRWNIALNRVYIRKYLDISKSAQLLLLLLLILI